jgi:small subunit ribosomal protein S6
MTREYELMVAISPQGGDEAFPQVLAQVNQLIANHGGVVVTSLTNPPWGHRRLAYPIQDFRDAYYAVLHLTMEPTRLAGLERDLQLVDQVIRFMVVRRDEAIKAEAKAAARRPATPQPESEEAGGVGDGAEPQ